VSSSEIDRPRGRFLPLAIVAAIVISAAACTPPVKQYELNDQPFSCDEANRLSYATARAMGFAISEFTPATPGSPGAIRGRRNWQGSATGRQSILVKITCSPTGSTIDANEDGQMFGQIDLKRGFYQAFTNIVSMGAAEKAMEEKIDAGTAPASQQRRDLQIVIEPIRGQESKLDFDVDLAAAGILPLRVNVNNRTPRTYEIDPAETQLTAADRSRVRPLSPEQAGERISKARGPDGSQPVTSLSAEVLGERLRAKLLTAATVRPGDKASGYLYFPLAEYHRARVVAVEKESGESEGFLVEF
jgi:hypothetical protein